MNGIAHRSLRENLRLVAQVRAWRLAIAGPSVYWYFPVFYLLLVTNGGPGVLQVLSLLVALVLSAAWGFLLNDLFDRYADSVAGRTAEERGHLVGFRAMLTLIVLTAAISWGIVLALGGGLAYKLVLLSAYTLSVLYSVPPIKLKARSVLGFIADSLMERPLPIVVIFSFFGYYGWEIVAFPILTEFSWSIFKHQADDVDKDALANVNTLAVSLGHELSYRIVFNFLNPLSVAAVVTLGLIAWWNIPAIRWLLLPILLVIVSGVTVSAILQRREMVRTLANKTDPPYTMFLNFAYRVLLLPALGLGLLSLEPGAYPLLLLLLLSLLPHLMYYAQVLPPVLGGLGTNAQDSAGKIE